VKLEALMPHYLKEQQPPPSVRAMIRLSWPKFVRFCDARGILRVAEVTQTVLEDFYKGLLWEPNESGLFYKANSVDQFVRRVRQVLRWSFEQGLLERDPTVGLLLPRPLQPVPKPLSWKQLQTLLSAPDSSTPLGLRDALLLQIMAESELALTQVVALTEDSVRELELEATTWTLLTDYLERGRPALTRAGGDEKALFLGKLGDPLGSQAAATRLNEMVKQVGLGRRLPTRILRQSYQAALQPLRDRHSKQE
jgi:integrase/recombinase XerD